MHSKVILDVDDTLLGWSEGFVEWSKLEGILPRSHVFNQHQCIEKLPYLNGREFYDGMFVDFNRSASFGCLPVIPDAQRLIRDILESGRKIWIISACGTNSKVTERLREAQLNVIFGKVFEKIFIVPINESKQRFIDVIGPDSVLIDDSFRHVSNYAARGGDSIWFDFCEERFEFNGLGVIRKLSDIYEKFPYLVCPVK